MIISNFELNSRVNKYLFHKLIYILKKISTFKICWLIAEAYLNKLRY